MAIPERDQLACPLLGESPPMQSLRALVRQIAPANGSVLITGPSGSGKECVARALHGESGRARGPFVAINCGAIPRGLLESELFGHEKGAFTGAIARCAGRFEEADGGTLFLDEIGDMPPEMQVKLLRVLEDQEVQRVGGRGKSRVNVRVVSATHHDLNQAIRNGSFREDLYYRLAVLPIALPALVERLEDIPLLLRHFGTALSPVFSPEALARLTAHDWPGNLRQLRNLATRAAVLYPGDTLTVQDTEYLLGGTSLGGPVNAGQSVAVPSVGPGGVDLPSLLARLESQYIRAALDRSDGVVAEAARLLGLRRTTLIDKLRRQTVR